MSPLLTPSSIRQAPTWVFAILAAWLLHESPPIAAAGLAKQEFNIPAQPLQSAISQLSEEADLQISYPAELTKGIGTLGLSGHYTAKEALNKLLAGSGLTPKVTSTNAITIEKTHNIRGQAETGNVKPAAVTNPKPSTNDGVMLEKVTVEADAEYDAEYYADPYNKDYVLPNATAGTKTDTPIMETPLNVQVISKQVLKDQQVIRLADALKNVSGVVTRTNTAAIGTAGGANQVLTLRGFESETFFRNGFRLQQGSASRELANVESVEVLKGPAAILYGLVEPGGMVNVVTKKPLATPYYGFTQQFGSYDLYRTTLDATGPLTKNKDFLYRVNLSYENSGSFRDLVGKEDVFFAPVLKWVISPRTQATFEIEYDHNHLATENGFVPAAANGTPLKVPINRNYGGYSPNSIETIFGGFNWSHQFNDDWALKHRFSVNRVSADSPFNVIPQGVGSRSFWINFTDSLGAPEIAQPLFSKPERDYVLRSLQDRLTTQNNTYSTNLDLVGHFDTWSLKHTLLTGGDYYRTDSTSDIAGAFYSYAPANNLRQPIRQTVFAGPRSTGSSKVDQYGLYIQDQIKLPFDFHVTGGIRWQYIHQVDSSPSASTQDAVTPRVGILWNPEKWVSLYANYTESFGANGGKTFVSPGIGKIIDPTSAAQYEGGIKFQFFDNKLRGTLAYYDLIKTNIGIGDPNHPGPNDCGVGQGCSIALGEVRSRGPELDITGEVLPGWNVIATWANTDIRITKTNANNDTIPANGADLAPGSRLPNVPLNTGSLWSTYEVQDGDFKGLTFGGGATLRDNSLTFGQGNRKLPGYATFALMAGYSREIGNAKVSVQLNVDNLFDKRAFNSVYSAGTQRGAYVDFVAPRTFMGQVSVQY